MASRGDLRRVTAAVVAAVVLLSSAVGFGLRVPGESWLAPLADRTLVEVTGWRAGRLPVLAPGFLARVLGIDGPERIAAIPAADQDPHRPTAARPVGSGMLGDGRVVVTHAGGNDRIARAYEVPSVPFTARTDTTGAAREADEPGDCSPTGGTVWYRYTPERDRNLLASTLGSAYPLTLGVYEQQTDGSLRNLGCGVGPAGHAEVRLLAKGGTAYLFQVAGTAGGGQLVFNLDLLGTYTRASEMAEGGSDSSEFPSISADGSRVAFSSQGHVYVRDVTTGALVMASVSPAGEPANGLVDMPTLSPDGRYVAFGSTASNLVEGDTNGFQDVFVHDLQTRTTARVSVSSTGEEGRLPLTWLPDEVGHAHVSREAPLVAFSHGGRHVAFISELAGLVQGDEPNCAQAAGPAAPADVVFWRCRDVFVRDTASGATAQVSVDSDGTPSDGDSRALAMSWDGRYVAFSSNATNLVPDRAIPGIYQLYVHDRDADGNGIYDEPGGISTVLASASPSGAPGDGDSGAASGLGKVPLAMSADGRVTLFSSQATNLDPADGDRHTDLYVHDRVAGTTTMVAAARTAGHGPGQTLHTYDMSADGRWLAFALEWYDPLGEPDVPSHGLFVYDRVTNASPVRVPAPDDARSNQRPRLSADGRHLAFVTHDHSLADSVGHDCPANREGCHVIYVYERPSPSRERE